MRLTEKESHEIRKLLRDLPVTEEAARMKQYVQHGEISTYDHVISVVRLSFLLNRNSRYIIPSTLAGCCLAEMQIR